MVSCPLVFSRGSTDTSYRLRSTRSRSFCAAGYVGVEGNGVVLVRHAWSPVKFDRHACPAEGERVPDVLVAEDVQLPHLNVRGRQAGGVRQPARRRRRAAPVPAQDADAGRETGPSKIGTEPTIIPPPCRYSAAARLSLDGSRYHRARSSPRRAR
jgi:hypothetical protein